MTNPPSDPTSRFASASTAAPASAPRRAAHRTLGSACVLAALACGCGLEVADGASQQAGVASAALTAGEVDGDSHPYVGLMVIYGTVHDADGQVIAPTEPTIFVGGLEPLWWCSGSALSEDLFLTAGHCTAPRVEDWDGDGSADHVTPVLATMSFGAGPLSLVEVLFGFDSMGTPEAHPDFNWAFLDARNHEPNSRDIGVVHASVPIELPEYGVVAAEGILDEVLSGPKNDAYLVAVGYGLRSADSNGDKPGGTPEIMDLERRQATEHLLGSQGAWTGGYNIQTGVAPRAIPHATLEAGPSDPDEVPATLPVAGGPCFGDSGGPQLLDGEIVGITSFVLNKLCKGLAFHYRTDIPDSADFLQSF